MYNKKKESNGSDIFSREKIIDHLTKEIEVLTTNIMTFRIRAAFTVWVGPFFLLGSLIIATDGSFQLNTNNMNFIYLVAILACLIFVALGIVAGGIEQQVWSQCDKWRRAISRIATGEIQCAEEIYQALKDERMSKVIIYGYLIVFVLILGTFLCTIYIAANVSKIG